MTIDLSSITRRFQPAAVLASVSRLLRREETRQTRNTARNARRERRSMNG